MLYSQEMVNLLQQLRSRILAEFGVRIRLADPELFPSLIQMGRKSRDRMTVETIKTLLKLADMDVDLTPVPAPSSAPGGAVSPAAATEVTYRGNKIARDSDSQTGDAAEAARRSAVTRQVYRGQVVYK